MTMRRTMTWSFCDLHLHLIYRHTSVGVMIAGPLVQILRRRRAARSSMLYNLLGSSSLRLPLGRSFVALRILNENGYSTVLMRLIEMRCRHLAAASETYYGLVPGWSARYMMRDEDWRDRRTMAAESSSSSVAVGGMRGWRAGEEQAKAAAGGCDVMYVAWPETLGYQPKP